jgi:hypothetical protein
LYLLFPPPSSLSIDADTAGDPAEYDYYADDPSVSVEQPGKHSPLFDHPDIAYIYLLLALE